MKTRAKSAKATATAMKPKVALTKKKSRKKPSASSSAKDDHRDKPKKPPTAFFYYLYASLHPDPLLLRSCFC
ncbi:hypothetical protein B296_00034454 [Ensete ventricosum]|uniref:Uncharacterized protein n=1 Tax=Ensete ventricosum TaxID=4639 RepID=A0A426X3U2_ENSVE|nr:hypothetical protein B296_00034454 [Ensete ventricosum]